MISEKAANIFSVKNYPPAPRMISATIDEIGRQNVIGSQARGS